MAKKTNENTKSEDYKNAELELLNAKIDAMQNRNDTSAYKSNDFKPNVMAIPTAQTAPVQTQMLGTQYYDNTPAMFVAPGYGQWNDLATKRSNQAVATSSAWDKTKANFINNIPNIDDPEYKAVQGKFVDAMAQYEDKLNQGDWADQSTMVSSFVDDLINKKGGKQFAGLKYAVEEQRKAVEEKLANYDAEKGVGGMRNDETNYALTPKLSPPVYDNEGNIIGGLTYNYPQIYESRNVASELNEFMSKVKGSSTKQTDKDGNEVMLINTPMYAQYGLIEGTAYTPAQVQAAAMSYMKSTGANEYLQYLGKVKDFNNGMDVDSIRENIGRLAEANKNDTFYQTLLNLTDEQLATEAKRLDLGARFYADDLQRNLIEGAIATNSYNQDKLSFVTDEAAMDSYKKEQEILLKQKYGIPLYGTGSGQIDENGNPIEDVSYVVSSTSINDVNAPAMYSPMSMSNALNQANTDLKTINAQLEGIKRNSDTYESSADYKRLSNQKAEIESKLKIINSYQAQNFQELNNVAKEATKTGLATLIQLIQTDKTSSSNKLTSQELSAGLMVAIYAETDDNPNTNALDILKERGINSSIDSSNFKMANKKSYEYISKYYNRPQKAIFNSSSETVDMVGDDSSPTTFNLLSYIKDVSKKYTSLTKEKDRQGNKTYNSPIQIDSKVITVTGATEKNVEAKQFENAIKDISSGVEAAPTRYKVWNPFSNSTETLDQSLINATGSKPNVLNDVVKFTGIQLASNQDFAGNKGLVYYATYELKDPSERDNKNAYDAVQKAKKLIGANKSLSIPIQLGANDNKDIGVRNNLTKLLKRGVGVADPVTKQNMLLTIAKLDGVASSIDSAYLYNLDGSGKAGVKNTRDLRMGDADIRVKAINDPISYSKMDKSFEVYVKDTDGQYKMVAYDKENKPVLVTDAELKAGKGSYTKKPFDTTEDIKAYLTEVRLTQQGTLNSNFRIDGSKNPSYGTDRPADKSKIYEYDLVKNGQPFKVQAYIPKENVVDIRGKVKFSSNAGIPFVNKDIADNAISLANNYGLTVSGGLRTQNHAVSDSATNSSHFNGNSLDFRLDNNSRKLYQDIKRNPNLAQRLGIQFSHDGDHIHITFSKPQTNVSMQKNYSTSSVMKAIAQGESSNRDLGYHYKDTKSTSAFGKYGFTDSWINRMATYYNTSADVIRRSPNLVEEYANTEYIRLMDQETAPYLSKLKEKLGRYIPNFSKEDAIFIYHYGGGNRLKQLARGELSADSIPAPQYNTLSFKDYVLNKRKYLR